MSRLRRRTVLGAPLGLLPRGARAAGGWRELWNGRDLAGWQTWLGRPHRSVAGLDVPRDEHGEYTQAIGVGRDPRGVFTVVRDGDGRPALRISGELFGALTSDESFGDYHLLMEWRWGQARFAPRAEGKRDSGVLYHASGAHGVSGPSRNWMRSFECQIQEGDCGDFWSVAGTVAEAPVVEEASEGQVAARFAPGGRVVTVPFTDPAREPRIRRAVDVERPRGDWNVVEVLTVGDRAVHRVNGREVMRLGRMRAPDGRGGLAPVSRGRIQIQSEGAEILFRRIALRSLARL